MDKKYKFKESDRCFWRIYNIYWPNLKKDNLYSFFVVAISRFFASAYVLHKNRKLPSQVSQCYLNFKRKG